MLTRRDLRTNRVTLESSDAGQTTNIAITMLIPRDDPGCLLDFPQASDAVIAMTKETGAIVK